MQDLSAKSAYELKTPYAFWQEGEGIPTYGGYWIEDVRTVELADWQRTGGQGAFVNLNGAGMNCDAHSMKYRRSSSSSRSDISMRKSSLY
jgi:hypothetical protein